METALKRRTTGKYALVLLDDVGREIWELDWQGDEDGFHNAVLIHNGLQKLAQAGYALEGVGPALGQYYLSL